MGLMRKLIETVVVAMCLSVAIVSFAEDAPVFEVDSYPPPLEKTVDENESPAETMQSAAEESNINLDRLTPEQRLVRIEQQLNYLQQSNAATKMEALQREVQSLRGQVEVLSHALEQASIQQKAMYADLDKRLTTPPTPAATTQETSTPEKSAITAPQPKKLIKPMAETRTNSKSDKPQKLAVTVNQPNVAEEQQIYQTAYDLIRNKKYNEAITALQKMLVKYPSGQFAANAHYWLGELYGLLSKDAESAAEFSTIVTKYPESPKISDAMLKLGLIYAGQFKWTDAKNTFKKVINQYPGSPSARIATEQLKQIKIAGH